MIVYFSPIDETFCAPWPSTSSKNACTNFGGNYTPLNPRLDISKTKECERLCKHQKSGGCCYLGGTTGCFWKPDATSSIDISAGGEERTAVTCYNGNQYLVLK